MTGDIVDRMLSEFVLDAFRVQDFGMTPEQGARFVAFARQFPAIVSYADTDEGAIEKVQVTLKRYFSGLPPEHIQLILSESRDRTERIVLYVTPEEKRQFKDYAGRREQSMSDAARDVLKRAMADPTYNTPMPPEFTELHSRYSSTDDAAKPAGYLRSSSRNQRDQNNAS